MFGILARLYVITAKGTERKMSIAPFVTLLGVTAQGHILRLKVLDQQRMGMKACIPIFQVLGLIEKRSGRKRWQRKQSSALRPQSKLFSIRAELKRPCVCILWAAASQIPGGVSGARKSAHSRAPANPSDGRPLLTCAPAPRSHAPRRLPSPL